MALWTALLLLALGLCWLGAKALTLRHRETADNPAKVPEASRPKLDPPADPAPVVSETSRLSRQLLEGDRDARRDAARQLAALNDPDAVEFLKKTFAGGDDARRKEMAEDLVALRTPAAMQILRLVLNDQSRAVRQPVMDAMTIKDSAGQLELIECALDANDRMVRLAAVRAVQGLKGERAIGLLRRAVDDKGFGIGHQAAEMLGEVGGRASQPILIELLSHPSWQVRHGALLGLGPACGETGYSEEVVDAMLKTLSLDDDDQAYQVRSGAAFMLGAAKTPRVRDALIAQLQVESYELPRNRILEVLAASFANDPVAQAVVKKPPPMPRNAPKRTPKKPSPPPPTPHPIEREVF